MFSKSRNPFKTFLLSYHLCVISKIQVNFRFERYRWFCLMNFWNFHTIHVFLVRESIADISTELPCLNDLENPGRLPVQHLCFWGRGIQCWHSHWTTMFEGPQNSGQLPVREVFVVTQTFVPWQKCSEFISSRAKDAWRSNDQCFIANCIVMSCHVTSCHVTLYHAMSRPAMSRDVTSNHILPRHAMSCPVTSCHTLSRHVPSRHATSCHVMSVIPRHVMPCHVMSRPATSCYVMSRYITPCHVLPCHAM